MRKVLFTYLGHSIELPQGDSTVGRAVSCLVRFNDPGVSRNHCRVRVHGERVTISDLGSSNGTRVNGKRIEGAVELHDGDRIDIDSRTLHVVMTSTENAFEDETVQYAQIPSPPPAAPKYEFPPELDAGTVTQRITTFASPPGEERRLHARHSVEVRAIYKSRRQTLDAVATDLSRSGACLTMPVADEIGTECEVTILADAAPALTLQGWVVRMDEKEPGAFGAGIEFIHMRPQDLRALEDTILRLGTPRRR